MGHIHEKIDFTAEVFIVHEGKVLLKRHKKFGSIWLSVGGHIELDEDPTEAAVREVKEEVGLDVQLYTGHQQFKAIDGDYRDIIPPIAVGRHRVNDVHEHVVFVYFASSASDAVVTEDPTDEWKWVSREELAQMDLRDNVRAYAVAALDALAS